MTKETKTTSLNELLEASQATNEFKNAVQVFESGLESDLIKYSSGAPRVKVLRVLMKLLEMYADKKISSVSLEGSSSCSGFVGKLVFEPECTEIEFDWDCYWKAEQENMIAWYGMPDQTKAAQIFGYQCFKKFEQLA